MASTATIALLDRVWMHDMFRMAGKFAFENDSKLCWFEADFSEYEENYKKRGNEPGFLLYRSI